MEEIKKIKLSKDDQITLSALWLFREKLITQWLDEREQQLEEWERMKQQDEWKRDFE